MLKGSATGEESQTALESVPTSQRIHQTGMSRYQVELRIECGMIGHQAG